MISLKTVWLAFLVLGSCVATGIYIQIEDIPQIVQSIEEAIPDDAIVPVPEALDDPPDPEGGYDPPGGMAT